MRKKTIILLALKLIALTITLFLCFTVASILSGVSAQPTGAAAPSGQAQPSSAQAGATALTLLLACFLQALVLGYIILRSRWNGWKLVGAIFLAFFGIGTVLAQIESIVYLPRHLPPGMIPKLFIMGAITAGLFSPLAVLILGKMKRETTPQIPNLRLIMPWREWIWKLATIAVAYLILYFTFGYFVAWKNPAVQAYYGGTDPGNFFAQMAAIWSTVPWMFALQIFRAMLWTLFTLPIIRMFKGGGWELGLAVALLFAVWSSMLLLPNPFMPEEVARTHLIETVASNFIFGLVMAWLLNRHHASVRELFPILGEARSAQPD